MRRDVDEVRKGCHRSRTAYSRTVESGHEDLRMCGEGVCEVEVVGDEVLEPVMAGVGVGFGSSISDVCSALYVQSAKW